MKHRNSNTTLWGLLFLTPSLIGLMLFIIIPIFISLVLSFSSWNVVSGLNGIKFVGLKNFIRMFHDAYFLKSLWNNVVYSLVFVPLTMIIGLLLAIAMNKEIYGIGALRSFFFLPYVTNVVAVSIVWMALLNPVEGPINEILRNIGISNPPAWLSDKSTALMSIIIVNVWLNVGYAMVIFLGALQAIPRDIYEAASIDGVGVFRKFFQLTLPLISPTTFFILITTIINSFKVFGTVNIMTQGGPNGDATTVLVFDIYQNAFRYYKMGYASAMSWFLFAIIFTVTLIQWQGQKKWVGYSA